MALPTGNQQPDPKPLPLLKQMNMMRGSPVRGPASGRTPRSRLAAHACAAAAAAGEPPRAGCLEEGLISGRLLPRALAALPGVGRTAASVLVRGAPCAGCAGEVQGAASSHGPSEESRGGAAGDAEATEADLYWAKA